MSIWPEVNGRPAAKVSMGLSEKIGLPKFSNVDVGPVTIERFCEDTPEARMAAIAEISEQCEVVIAEERAKVLEWIKQTGGLEQ